MRVFDFDRAIVRTPGPSVVDGLRADDRGAPSYEGVLAEHRAYIGALEGAGVSVETLEPLDAFPDSVFVEDPAFVLPEGAILLKPGAPSRMGEAAEIEPVLRRHFDRVLELGEGYADGGDILILPNEILIGLSARTDRTGAARFVTLVAKLGHKARIVETPRDTLHFKTASSLVDEQTVIATPALAPCFVGYDVLLTPEGEEAAANMLRVNDTLLVSAAYPRTVDLLAGRGFDPVPLDTREIAKIEAGLSCMSLRWKATKS